MKSFGPSPQLLPRSLQIIALLLLTAVVLGLSGCKETINPNTDPRQRQSWLFFNYSVKAPDQKTVEKQTQKILDGQYLGQSLRVLVWDHFIPTNVTEQFQEDTGARIIVSTYDNTTELRERLRGGEAVDLILTASFMIEQLHSEDRLDTIDAKNIPNIEHLAPDYKNPVYDPTLSFCVPYLWTTAGIAYNYNALDVFPQTWGNLLVPDEDQLLLLRNRVALLPVPQRAYGAALIHLGYSIDTENKDEISAAAKLISRQNEVLRFRFGRASMIDGLSTGEILMAQAYSNEAARAQIRNQSVRFCIPEDGSWVTHHCFAIPKGTTAKKKDLAEVFINYLMQPTVAAEVVNYSLCASTIPETQAYVRANVRLGPTYMLPADPDKRFLQVFTPKMEEFRNLLWQELTAGMPMDSR